MGLLRRLPLCAHGARPFALAPLEGGTVAAGCEA